MTTKMRNVGDSLDPHWKIRVVLHGGMLHLASSIEPSFEYGYLQWKDVADHRYGDTVGHIDWDAVEAVTWRYSE